MSTNEPQNAQAQQNADNYKPSDRWAAKAPLPGVGHLVVFHPRPGEGRSGRLFFPALVLSMDTGNGNADLLVFYDQDDVRSLKLVPPRSEQNARGWVSPTPAMSVDSEPQGALIERLSKVEGGVKGLLDQVYGDSNIKTDEPLMTLFAEFHRSIESLKGQVETLQQRLAKQEAGAGQAKAAAKKAPPKRK